MSESALAPLDADDARTASVLAVLTTTDSQESAGELARGVIAARLAACAQVSAPVTSLYRWEGAVQEDREWQVLFKVAARGYQALEDHLRTEHPYDVPEIIATPVVRGSAEYLTWVEEETV